MASLQEKRQIKGLENCIKDSNSTPIGFRSRLDNLRNLDGYEKFELYKLGLEYRRVDLILALLTPYYNLQGHTLMKVLCHCYSKYVKLLLDCKWFKLKDNYKNEIIKMMQMKRQYIPDSDLISDNDKKLRNQYNNIDDSIHTILMHPKGLDLLLLFENKFIEFGRYITMRRIKWYKENNPEFIRRETARKLIERVVLRYMHARLYSPGNGIRYLKAKEDFENNF